MPRPKLTKLELRIMEVLWTRGACSVREIQDAFPEPGRPAFTTIQTTIYRLEGKQAVHIAKRIGNANIFEAAISRRTAENNLVDDFLSLFGGRVKPVIARLIESGKLSLDDVKEAEQALQKLERKGKSK
ncbi:Transcriptional repressor, CopY family [Candidatus Sulfopaludibacter sp. SbA3]|nr:Transcriptional repressor, CopY family [Candidatus Sulfopaludibacter sp. SbA3]